MHFSVSACFQIPAHKAGHGKVPWKGPVSVCAGHCGGTWALTVPRSSISEIRGVWE